MIRWGRALFRRLHKLRKTALSVVMSVRPFAWNNSAPTPRVLMKFDIWAFFFWKICSRSSNLIKICQEYRVLYMKTFSHLWQYLAEFFLEWEMFRQICRDHQNTHFMCNNFYSNRGEGDVARMGERKGAYRFLVGNPEGRRPLGKPRLRWQDTNKMDLCEVGWGRGTDWIDLAQDRDSWRALVNAVMNLLVP